MSASTAIEGATHRLPPRRWRLGRVQEAGLVIVIVVLGVLLTALSEPVYEHGRLVNNFFRVNNLVPNVFTPMSWMAIMAIGVTFVIIAGGIDISVGSIFGLAALGAAAAVERFGPQSSAVAILAVGILVPIAIGLACGIINGLLVVGLRMHPFIVTLATLSIFRGIAIQFPKALGETQSLPSFGRVLPDVFTTRFLMYTVHDLPLFGQVNVQPAPMLVMLATLLIGGFYLRFTVGGRQIYAVGGNEEAARFSGLPVGRIKLRVYALSGLVAGIAAMVSCGYYGSANTETGLGAELMVIAAAVVGGASLSGGRGTVLGAVLGALVIQMIYNGIFVLRNIKLGFATLHLSKEYSLIIIGTAILVAVAIDQVSERLRARRVSRTKVGGMT